MCIRDRLLTDGEPTEQGNVADQKPTIVNQLATLRQDGVLAVSYTHLRAHETVLDLVCRLLLEKKKDCTPPLRLFYHE